MIPDLGGGGGGGSGDKATSSASTATSGNYFGGDSGTNLMVIGLVLGAAAFFLTFIALVKR